MRFTQLALTNFGPISSGTISTKKITVFFGPNNSGKSMVSRLIHSISSIGDQELETLDRYFLRSGYNPADLSKKLKGYSILDHAGIDELNIITFGKTNCTMELKTKKGIEKFKFDRKIDRRLVREAYHVRRRFGYRRESEKKVSIYIPAARTGTIQFFSNITQMRSRLLSDILESFGNLNVRREESFSAIELKNFVRSLSRLPTYLEEFYDLILDAQTLGLSPDVQNLFRMIFGGTVSLRKEEGVLA